jgi:hypothetical protein
LFGFVSADPSRIFFVTPDTCTFEAWRRRPRGREKRTTATRGASDISRLLYERVGGLSRGGVERLLLAQVLDHVAVVEPQRVPPREHRRVRVGSLAQPLERHAAAAAEPLTLLPRGARVLLRLLGAREPLARRLDAREQVGGGDDGGVRGGGRRS